MDILYSRHLIKCCSLDWICITHNTLHLSKMRRPHYSIKRTDFAVPLVRTWTVQNLLDNAGRPLTQDCPASLIDSPTGHFINTGTHTSSLWLSFLAIVQQGKVLEHAIVTQRHEYALPSLTENIPEASEVGTPFCSDGTNGVWIIEDPLYLIAEASKSMQHTKNSQLAFGMKPQKVHKFFLGSTLRA